MRNIGTIENRFKRQIEGTPAPRVSVLSLRLPEGKLASTPAEARTVVLLDWDHDSPVSYGSGGISAVIAGYAVTGYSVVLRVSVIDRSRHLSWTNQRTFRGPPLPEKIVARVFAPVAYGDVPYDDIEKYLRTLPRCVE